ncbi:hypothetical protein HY947_04880 [Candidatus Gottesmanbacteria bacterium]|nr:hypothetical protein [Candidatus Gottesmanbacteria bacterium]
MNQCNYCDETDESRLAIRSSFVKGEVKHEWVCLSCMRIFILLFVTGRENGNALSERKAQNGKSLLGSVRGSKIRD